MKQRLGWANSSSICYPAFHPFFNLTNLYSFLLLLLPLPPQVIGAVVDVEFDNVEDVPDILNALKVKLNVEKFSEKNDRIRTASLLPKQLREARRARPLFRPQRRSSSPLARPRSSPQRPSSS